MIDAAKVGAGVGAAPASSLRSGLCAELRAGPLALPHDVRQFVVTGSELDVVSALGAGVPRVLVGWPPASAARTSLCPGARPPRG
jgi:hypothetical protein